MIDSEVLNHPGIAHGFFTRGGGHSTGIFASLNCGLGSGDDPDLVRLNREIVAGGSVSCPPISSQRIRCTAPTPSR